VQSLRLFAPRVRPHAAEPREPCRLLGGSSSRRRRSRSSSSNSNSRSSSRSRSSRMPGACFRHGVLHMECHQSDLCQRVWQRVCVFVRGRELLCCR
jgi:hypothetical protein